MEGKETMDEDKCFCVSKEVSKRVFKRSERVLGSRRKIKRRANGLSVPGLARTCISRMLPTMTKRKAGAPISNFSRSRGWEEGSAWLWSEGWKKGLLEMSSI